HKLGYTSFVVSFSHYLDPSIHRWDLSNKGDKTVSKKLRGTGIALALLAVMMIVAACGGSQGSSSGSGQVAAIIKGLDNPFFQAMQQGIQDQAKAQGTNVS